MRLFGEINGNFQISTIFCDSNTIILTKDQKFDEKTKYIYMRYHFMRDVIVHSDIVVSKVDIKENPADMVTITLFVAILSVAWTWLVFVVELALKGLC